MKNLLPLLLLPWGLWAQSSITGKILDKEGVPVSFANVILNQATDSSMVKLEYSNDDGSFSIPNVDDGAYYVSVSYVGLAEYRSEVFQYKSEAGLALPNIEMGTVSNELAEVVVNASRPILEIKPDRLVFNVEGSINAAGSDAFELLRKAPGVVIDNNDNIMLAGKSGVRVFINGKPSPLNGEDLVNFLRSLNSNEIDNIEIITNPSAKYEAEGNAGIINIVLKKDKKLGSNATLNLGYGQGRTWSATSGISANYRDKRANLFGSASYRRANRYWLMHNEREFQGLSYDARSLTTGPNHGYNVRAGADFFLSPKSTLGLLLTGNFRDDESISDSYNHIGTVGGQAIDSTLQADTERQGQNQNLTYNLNYQYQLSKGKTLTLDADYGQFRRQTDDYQPNQYISPNGLLLSEDISLTEAPTDIDIYTFKADYEQRFLQQGKLELGIKNAWVVTDNTFDFYNRINGEDQIDVERSSRFEYLENVNAAYAQFTYPINSKWGVSGGLRVEQTNTRGTLSTYDPLDDYIPTKRHYVDFFPSAGITYNPAAKHSFSLTYGRRLDRPNYQNLNPFRFRVNELSYFAGNPFLRPQYSNNIKLNHTFNYRFNTSIGFSHTKDLMTRVSDVDGQALNLTWKNVSNQYNYDFTFAAPYSFKEWWGSFSNLTAYHVRNQADASEEIEAIDIKVTGARLYSQHTFTLPWWGLKYELSGWASTPSIWGGVFEVDANWSIDMGLSKKILGDKANIKLNFNDIFYSAGWEGRNKYGQALYEAYGRWDSRRVQLDFSYFFGNDKVKSRRRKTGLEDEKGRTGGDGGGQ